MRRGEAIWHEANCCVFSDDPKSEGSKMRLFLTAVPDGISVESHSDGTMSWRSVEILRDWLTEMLAEDVT